MEDGLGAVAPPTHARAIQAHADEVAHSAFDHATGDWQVLATEFLVAHPSGLLVKWLTTFSRTSRRYLLPLLLRDPRFELLALAARSTANRLSCVPELLDDVKPVEALLAWHSWSSKKNSGFR